MSETVTVVPTDPHTFTLKPTPDAADEVYGQAAPFGVGADVRATWGDIFNWIKSQTDTLYNPLGVGGGGGGPLVDGSVTTAKLADDAVTADKLGDAAAIVTYLGISDGAQGPAGPPGADGVDGVDGVDGADGANFTVDETGLFANRSNFDNEAEGFAYLSTDGDGASVTTAVIFIRETATPGTWSGAIPFQGPPGDKGDIGNTGPQGPQGIQGVPGDDGADGPQGIQGPAGPAGAPGDDGNDGAQGPQGIQGPAGADGAQGPAGATGADGPQGPQGIAGPAGSDGVDGTNFTVDAVGTFAGRSGFDAEAEDFAYLSTNGDGASVTTAVIFIRESATPGVWSDAIPFQGPIGPDGVQGDQGVAGPAGPQGPQGIQGQTGNDGADGDPGPTGAAGPQGPQGIQGIQGPAGDDGADGAQGPQGIQGPAGADGDDGAVGPQGPQGVQGVAGNDGADGADGSTVRSGTTVPSAGLGNDGDFYIRTTTNEKYGPKTGGAWGAPVSLIGPQGAVGPQGDTGPQGPQGDTGATGDQGPQGIQGATGPAGSDGADGRTVLNGTGAPGAGLGAEGDFYVQTDTDQIYGPKSGGAWGAATDLVGPIGPQGAVGPQGPAGQDGDAQEALDAADEAEISAAIALDASKRPNVHFVSLNGIAVDGTDAFAALKAFLETPHLEHRTIVFDGVVGMVPLSIITPGGPQTWTTSKRNGSEGVKFLDLMPSSEGAWMIQNDHALTIESGFYIDGTAITSAMITSGTKATMCMAFAASFHFEGIFIGVLFADTDYTKAFGASTGHGLSFGRSVDDTNWDNLTFKNAYFENYWSVYFSTNSDNGNRRNVNIENCIAKNGGIRFCVINMPDASAAGNPTENVNYVNNTFIDPNTDVAATVVMGASSCKDVRYIDNFVTGKARQVFSCEEQDFVTVRGLKGEVEHVWEQGTNTVGHCKANIFSDEVDPTPDVDWTPNLNVNISDIDVVQTGNTANLATSYGLLMETGAPVSDVQKARFHDLRFEGFKSGVRERMGDRFTREFELYKVKCVDCDLGFDMDYADPAMDDLTAVRCTTAFKANIGGEFGKLKAVDCTDVFELSTIQTTRFTDLRIIKSAQTLSSASPINFKLWDNDFAVSGFKGDFDVNVTRTNVTTLHTGLTFTAGYTTRGGFTGDAPNNSGGSFRGDSDTLWFERSGYDGSGQMIFTSTSMAIVSEELRIILSSTDATVYNDVGVSVRFRGRAGARA